MLQYFNCNDNNSDVTKAPHSPSLRRSLYSFYIVYNLSVIISISAYSWEVYKISIGESGWRWIERDIWQSSHHLSFFVHSLSHRNYFTSHVGLWLLLLLLLLLQRFRCVCDGMCIFFCLLYCISFILLWIEFSWYLFILSNAGGKKWCLNCDAALLCWDCC